MVDISRRGFIQLLGAAAIARLSPGQILIDERPVELIQRKDWIVDAGAYYQVTLPPLAKLARERFDKPVLFCMGYCAELIDCEVQGFVNIIADTALIDGLHIDAGRYVALHEREALTLLDASRGTTIIFRDTMPSLEMRGIGNSIIDAGYSPRSLVRLASDLL